MIPIHRTLRRTAAGILLLAATVAWGGCGGADAESGGGLRTYWRAPDFQLVDQQRDTVSSRDLRGTVWVAHIFFTHCRGVCPMTTARMGQVRDSLSAAGLLGEGVRLVSISVDPARDSVPVLQDWAGRYGDPAPADWAFLTGDHPERIRRMIQQGFHLSATLPPDSASKPHYQVSHSPRVLLVDGRGQVRGTYPILEPAAPGRIMADVRQLVR